MRIIRNSREKLVSRFYVVVSIAWCILVLILLLPSCTKYPVPKATFENYETGSDTQTVRKVLFICVDGARSEDVQNAKLSNITALLDHSKYSWDGLSDESTSDAATWASIATGVNSNQHLITDESFLPQSTTGAMPVFCPTFFYRIKEALPVSKNLSVSSWSALNDNLLIDADERINTKNDKETVDSALAHLQQGNETLVSVDLRSVLVAGLKGGFNLDNEDYKKALGNVDQYVGSLVNAIQSRSNIAKEEWLVIITSNHGADEAGYGGNSPEERQIFTIMYNPQISPLELHGNVFKTVRFFGSASTYNGGVRGIAQDPDGNYDPGTGSMTIEAKIKINRNSGGNYDYSWPIFLSKCVGQNSQGWYFFRNGSGLGFGVGDANGGNEFKSGSNVLEDGAWHSIAGTISYSGKTRNVKLYIDGSQAASGTMASNAAIAVPTVPVTIGYFGSYQASIDINVADIRIWNKALSSVAILEHGCAMTIDPSDPDIGALTGYWPGNDGGDKFVNQIAGKPDFDLVGDYSYNISANTLPCSAQEGAFQAGNTTVAPEIYYWLGINIDASWNLAGKSEPLL
jgi:hypothetical protein